MPPRSFVMVKNGHVVVASGPIDRLADDLGHHHIAV
jgi:hypothetical protein